MLIGLAIIATTHASKYVRGQAAGWYTEGTSIMRHNQATLARVVGEDKERNLLLLAVEKDKSNEPHKQKPRIAWAPLLDVLGGRQVTDELYNMLDGFEEVGSLLLDTDSSHGSPDSATRFDSKPLAGPRADRSLQWLLQQKPISLSRGEAEDYTHHAVKHHGLESGRILEFKETQQNELGRFSGSLAQLDALMPDEAMMARHNLRCAKLPDRYANETRLDVIAPLLTKIVDAHRRLYSLDKTLASIPMLQGWAELRAAYRRGDAPPDTHAPP